MTTNNERLNKAIESVIYWVRKYSLVQKELINTEEGTRRQVLEDRTFVSRTHVLGACEFLARVYEQETGIKVERIGNLQPLSEIAKLLEEREVSPYI